MGVVTGAGSGIGRALAHRLAQERMSLALADRDAAALEATARQLPAAIAVSTHVVDVADPNSMERFRDEVLARHRRVTLLINNAGVGLLGSLEELSVEEIDWLMRINFWGVVYGVKSFLPALRREHRAHLVNISSLFGLLATAGNSAYCASKFAVRGFTEVLQQELRGSTVGVSCVHPGTVRTHLSGHSRLAACLKDPSVFSHAGQYLLKNGRTSSEAAADRIVEGVRRGRARILIGPDAVWSDRLQRLFPCRYPSVLQLLRTLRQSLGK